MIGVYSTMGNPANTLRTYFVTFECVLTGAVYEDRLHGYSPEEVGATLLDDYEGIKVLSLRDESNIDITKAVFGE